MKALNLPQPPGHLSAEPEELLLMSSTPISIHPDRPIYQVASVYGQVFPYATAAISGLYTPGNRTTKVNAGATTMVHMLGFQQLSKAYDKWLDKMFAKHPKLAEQAYQHPFLVAFPLVGTGYFLSDAGGLFFAGLFRRLLERPAVQSRLNKALHSNWGDKLANGLRPIEKIANHAVVKTSLLVAALGTFGYFMFRIIQDHMAFGSAYNEARKTIPYKEMSPDELRKQVVLNRLMPPGKLNQLQEGTATASPFLDSLATR